MKLVTSFGRRLLYVLYLLATLEASLQVAAGVSPRLDVLLSNRFGEPAFVPDPVLGIRPNPRYGDHDSWGFRNAGEPERADVVALGDSQTYGVSATRDDAWPQQLGRRLGRRIYNMGCGSWGPGQYIPLLPKVAALRPTVVVASLYTGNDLWDMLEMAYLRQTIPELQPLARHDVALRAQVALAREALVSSGERAARLLGVPSSAASRVASKPQQAGGLVGLLRQRSRLWGACRALKAAIWSPRRAPMAVATDPEWRALLSAAADDQSVAVCGTGPTRTLLDAGYRAQALAEDLWPEGLRLAIETLVLVRDRLAKQGIALVVLLIPTKELAYFDACDEAQRQRSEYGRLVAAERQARAEATRTLTQRGLIVVDTLPGLERGLGAGLSAYPASIDSHPNAVGYGIIADVIDKELRGRRLMMTASGPDGYE